MAAVKLIIIGVQFNVLITTPDRMVQPTEPSTGLLSSPDYMENCQFSKTSFNNENRSIQTVERPPSNKLTVPENVKFELAHRKELYSCHINAVKLARVVLVILCLGKRSRSI